MLYRFRYIIGCIVVVLGVLFNINMSSIGVFNSVYNDSDESTTMIGVPREIRSDEWLVQTPFYFSQSEDNYQVLNDKINENAIIMYNAPVKDITIIGKPFNWGFLFLPKDRAYSFYWMSKLVILFLVSFEFCMIILKRNKKLSLFSALIITFSPGVQWWFMQHLGDLILFTLGIMTMLYYFLAVNKELWKDVLLAIGLTIFSIGFILVIYPAFQVPLAYLILFWLIGIVIIETPKFSVTKLALILGSIFAISMVCYHFYVVSADALKLLLNTIYPGARTYSGGSFSLIDFADPISNILLPVKSISNISNNCESAAFFSLMPFVPILLWNKRDYDKVDKYIFIFYVYLIYMFCFLVVGLPHIASKILLLNFTIDTRLATIIHFVSLLCTIMLLNNLVILKNIDTRNKIVVTLLFVLFWGSLTVLSGYNTYFGKSLFCILLVLLGVFMYMLLSYQKIAIAMIFCLVIISGMIVNPIVIGTGQIDNLKIVKEIKNINKHDKNARWVSETTFGDGILTASGANTFSSVRFYPDMKELNSISENIQRDEQIYNRYHRRSIEITKEKNTVFELIAPDNILIKMNIQDLRKLKINYVMSDKDLGKISKKFKLEYGPDKNGIRIYKLK